MERRREDRGHGARWLRYSIIAIGLAIVAYLVWQIWDYEALMNWMARARPVPFFLAMTIGPALGLPLTPFYLLAGATFDAGTALVGTVLAVSANLALCYVVGRSSLRRHLLTLFDRFGYDLPDFDAEAGKSTRSAIRFATLVKAAPGVPAFVKNYGLGAARIPFGVYFVSGLVFSAGYAIVLIVVGGSLFDHQLGRGTIAVLVLVAALLLLRWWHRRRGAPAVPALGT